MNKELSKEEINNWSIPDENGVIHIPDELDDLFNKLGMQMRFYTISGENEIVTVARMTQIAVKYADQEKKKEAIAFVSWYERDVLPFKKLLPESEVSPAQLYELFNQQK